MGFYDQSNNMDSTSISGTPCKAVKYNRIMSGEIWEFHVYGAEKTQCEGISNLWNDMILLWTKLQKLMTFISKWYHLGYLGK